MGTDYTDRGDVDWEQKIVRVEVNGSVSIVHFANGQKWRADVTSAVNSAVEQIGVDVEVLDAVADAAMLTSIGKLVMNERRKIVDRRRRDRRCQTILTIHDICRSFGLKPIDQLPDKDANLVVALGEVEDENFLIFVIEDTYAVEDLHCRTMFDAAVEDLGNAPTKKSAVIDAISDDHLGIWSNRLRDELRAYTAERN